MVDGRRSDKQMERRERQSKWKADRMEVLSAEGNGKMLWEAKRERRVMRE